MLRIAATRVAHLIAVLLGVSVLVFMLTELLPGDPAELIAAGSANTNPDAIEEIRKSLGLDKPLPIRYIEWLGHALTGNLGRSFQTNENVVSAINERLPVSVELIFLAEVVSLLIAVPVAIYAARYRDSIFDRAWLVVTFSAQAVPAFILSLLFIFLFAVTLRWLPAIGYVSLSTDPIQNLRSLAIPVMSLSAGLVPVYFRVLRSDVVKTLQEDHVLLARAEGMRSNTILFRYALRPSVSTLVTVVGVNIGTLIGGTVIVEQISGTPGLGTLLYTAIQNRDYTVIQGVVLVVAVGFTLANFAVDYFYSVLDPRVRA